ncbi:hypothetical protein [Campylobacter sp. CCS1377]|uniref:Transmembrane protein n=1 Tax=Campylobacter sp. CCS1377 TaxID=3158229 RepID=A0AAU7E5H5_9BACT|nr:hypothetical protein [Campylobacter jejuni]
MKYLIFILLSFSSIFGTEIQTINIYDRDNRIDLMLSFDNAYNGVVSQSKDGNYTLIALEDLSYSKEERKQLNSNLIKQLQISAKNNRTLIMLETKQDININTSSINDKFGLRIRILPKETEVNHQTTTNSTQTLNLANQNTQDEFNMFRYIVVIAILIFLSLLLWWLKHSLSKKNQSFEKQFHIVFQKQLDKYNRFVILDYENQRYTLILGHNNIILDKKEHNEEDKKEESFDSLFESNKQKIQDLILKKQKQN